MAIANIFATVFGIYLLIGFLFSIAFVTVGAGKIDPNAKQGTIGFRLLIVPGSIALWPVLALRWLKGQKEPPPEMNAHDKKAG